MRLLATLTTALCSGLAFAASYTWTGAGDKSKWTDAANWGGTGVPSGGDTATFNADATLTEDFAIGAGTVQVTVASGKKVYVKGVVSGAGGFEKRGSGEFHLQNTANTYTGRTAVYAGALYFKTIANIGEASSLGAPAAADALIHLEVGQLWMEDQTGTVVYSTDRPLDFVSGQFRLPFQTTVTVNLNGPMTGRGATWRGQSTFNIASCMGSDFTGNGRTDAGTCNFLCETNAFGDVNLSDGTFRGTVADKGVVSGLGSGKLVTFGQQNYNTTGCMAYNGATSTNCNRDLRIMVFTNGYYNANTYGGRILSETAGTCLTLDGNLTLSYDENHRLAHACPWFFLGGAGDGVLKTVLMDNVCVQKENMGTWTLAGENTTTGRVIVAKGRLDVDGSLVETCGWTSKVDVNNGAVLGGTGVVHGVVNVLSGGTLAPGHADLYGALALGPGTVKLAAGAKLLLKVAAGTNDLLVADGAIAGTGAVTVDLAVEEGVTLAAGTRELVRFGSNAGVSFVLGTGAPAGATLVQNGTQLLLYIPDAEAPTLTWTGAADATWDTSSENWTRDGAAAAYVDGAHVRFDDTSDVTNVTLAASVSPASVTVSSDATRNYRLVGGPGRGVTGHASLTKDGAGALTLDGDHSYDLPTAVNAGKLNLNGSLNGTSLSVAHDAVFNETATGVVAGDGISLRFGYGNHYLRGANTFAGTVEFNTLGAPTTNPDCSLHLYGTSPLGRASSVTVTGFGANYNTCTFLMLHNGTRVEDVLFKFGNPNKNYRAFINKQDGNGTGSWYGDVELVSGPQCYLRSDSGILELGRPGGTNEIRGAGVGFSFRGSGTIHVHSRIAGTGAVNRDDSGTVVLFNTNNVFPNTSFVQGTYQLGAANAWCTNATMAMGKASATGHSAFNLDGFDQALPGLAENNLPNASKDNTRRVYTPAGKPCTLTVANSAADYAWGSAFSDIAGPLSLVKAGTRTFTLNAATTFTGDTVVEGGTLAARAAGALGGSTNIVVKGGVLQVGMSTALNEEAEVTFAADSTGRIQLGDGVVQTVSRLFDLSRGTMPRTAGTYGSSQSAAAHKDDAHFAGTGVLFVRRGGGFAILFR